LGFSLSLSLSPSPLHPLKKNEKNYFEKMKNRREFSVTALTVGIPGACILKKNIDG